MPIYDIQDEPLNTDTADNTKAALLALGNFFTARKQAKEDDLNRRIRQQGMEMMRSGNIPEGFEGDYDTATGGFKYKFKGQNKKDALETELKQMELDHRRAANSGSAQASSIPSGYQQWTDPITGDTKLIEDKSFLNQKDQLSVNAEKRAEENRVANESSFAESMLSSIKKAKKGKNFFGAMGDLPSIVSPSTFIPWEASYGERADWEANVNNLLSNKVLETINELKSQSKTGATGFGALTAPELKILRESATVLNRKLTPDVAMGYLDDMEKVYSKIAGKGGSSEKFTVNGTNYTIPKDEVAQFKKDMGIE